MSWFAFSKNTILFEVVVHLNGRHPYYHDHSLDFETRDIVLTVPAKDWNDAAKIAMKISYASDAWSYSVKSIKKYES